MSHVLSHILETEKYEGLFSLQTLVDKLAKFVYAKRINEKIYENQDGNFKKKTHTTFKAL